MRGRKTTFILQGKLIVVDSREVERPQSVLSVPCVFV